MDIGRLKSCELLKQCCNLLEQKKLTIAFIESASSGYLSSQFSIYKHSGADILLGGTGELWPQYQMWNFKDWSLHLFSNIQRSQIEVTEAMALHGHRLFRHADIICLLYRVAQTWWKCDAWKPEGTFYIAIHYQNSLSTYHYLLLGSALERLDQLTKNVAQMVIERVQNA